MKSMRSLSVLAGIAMLAACVPQREAPPPPPPVRPVRPTPPPPPPPPPADWRDIPLTPGSWTYSGGDGGGSEAQFGAGGAPSFILRCDRGQGQITLLRAGATNGRVMTIRTSFGARNFPVEPGRQPVAAAVPAADRFLDSIAFSRGRFTVEAAGLPMLVIPSWAEPARVVEDCRG